MLILFSYFCLTGSTTALSTVMEITFKSIGVIHTPFTTKEGMPIQPTGAEGIKGTVELNQELADGLLDLSGFSHIYLVYCFHQSEGFDLQVTPFLDTTPHGVFATRAPRRPNSIGLSVVKLVKVRGNILEIENVDILDSTPLLDIKPYIPAFDIYQASKCGWMDNNTNDPIKTRADNRFK